MIKINRIQVRIKGDGATTNHHNGTLLAKAIGESIATKTNSPSAKIDTIRLLHKAPAGIHNDTLANDISNRIMTKIERS